MLNDTISHYRIVERIGVGGMGVVYKAIDLELDRPVALKVLPEHLAGDATAVDRLRREARAASALNEPGICTIYEIGEADGVVFIAMELLDGETLAARLKAGSLPLTAVIDLALDVVTALEHAHGRGVLHRDITPANIFLTSSGRAKLLDFGLAKLNPAAGAGASLDRTMTALSVTGEIVGTLPYMSPEQAKGQALDSRSDLFSLGLVLHECLVGRRVYSGSAAEVLSGILTVNPAPVSSGISGAPVELDRLLAKALEKDRDLRYRTASELRTDLKRVKRDLDAPAAAPAPSAARWRGLMLPAGVALLAVIGAGAYWVLTPPPAATALLADATFSQVTDLPGLETFPSLAPDGQSLVFASAHEGPWHIYSQRIGGRNLINLTADSTADNTQPALSPDGSRIAFRSSRDGGGIFIMGATGESVRRLTDLGYNPSWSPDATSIAFATEVVDAPTSRMSYSAVWAVDVATGDRRVITEDNAVQPSWSPDGARIAYWKVDSSGNRDIYTVPATGGEPVAITSDPATDWSPAWSPDGRFLFFSSDRGGSMNLWRVAIDAQSGRTKGPFEPITTPALNSGLLNFSRDGTRIAYVSQIASRNISRVDFDARLERTSRAPVPVTRGSRYLRFPSVSPDGKSIAYTSDEKLVVSLVDGSEFRQLTDGEFRDRAPRWSPDGSTLLFYSNRTGTYEVWSVRLDGSGLRQVTYGGPDVTFFYPVWSPDGRRVAFGDLKNRLNYFYDLETPWPGASPPALPPVPEARAVFAPWSWSAVAGLAGWTLREDGQSGGILIFDPASRSYRRLPGAGTRPLWLPDDRRLLTIDASGLSVVDAATGAARHLNVAAPLDDEFSLAPDASTIYFMQTERTGDIWVITLTEGNQAGR